MKTAACFTLTGLALLLANAFTVLATEPYYPYQTYEEYYKKLEPQPPEDQPVPPKPQPDLQAKPLSPQQPITLTQAPEFLFPAELGFGVAVAVPYDLFYLSGTYYYLRAGSTWYRASSYRGPWSMLLLSQVPTEFRKHGLEKIHQARNREFANYWKNKDHYQGRYFRPGMENIEKRKGNGKTKGNGNGKKHSNGNGNAKGNGKVDGKENGREKEVH